MASRKKTHKRIIENLEASGLGLGEKPPETFGPYNEVRLTKKLVFFLRPNASEVGLVLELVWRENPPLAQEMLQLVTARALVRQRISRLWVPSDQSAMSLDRVISLEEWLKAYQIDTTKYRRQF